MVNAKSPRAILSYAGKQSRCFISFWGHMCRALSRVSQATLLLCMQMQKIPDLEKLDIKDITSYGGAKEHGEERAKKHDKAASLYNHVRCPLHIPWWYP